MWYYMYPDTQAVNELPYYLSSIGQHDLQPRIVKPRGDENDQFFYNTKGDGTLILRGQYFYLPAGCGFFIPAGVPHEYYSNGAVWDIRWMCPQGEGLSVVYRRLGLKEGVYALRDVGGLERCVYKMREALLNDEAYGIYFASALVLEYLVEFAKQSSVPSDPARETEKMQKESVYRRHMNVVRDYVDCRFMNKITEKELCELIGVTPQHLCRIIRSCTGMSPSEYINHIRVSKAKSYLVNTDFNAGDIGRWCGYMNNNYFFRIFKKETGLSPCEYRRQYRGKE